MSYIRFAVLLPLCAILIGAGPPQGITIDRKSVLPGTINGAPARFHVAPNALSFPVINPEMARRLSLGSSIFGIYALVGPLRVLGKTGVVRIGVGGVVRKRRSLWFERPKVTDADAELGPDSLPHQSVRFMLRASSPGERRFSFPMVTDSYTSGFVITVGGQPLFIRVDPDRQVTLATAGATVLLSQAYGGELTGPAFAIRADFGIDRPARHLVLNSPFVVGGLTIRQVDVRTSDYGSVTGIADANADPSEIVVTAGKKTKARYWLTLGADALATCSSVTFDKARREIDFSCR